MRSEVRHLFLPLVLSGMILIILEIIATTLLPMLNLLNYGLSFNILLVLYMGFKLQTPYLAIMILYVQYIHSFFTIEGWEVGTIAGILTCILISYLRDFVHLTSVVLTILMTFLFQSFWFIVVSFIIAIKTGDMYSIVQRFWVFLPEAIVLALFSPILFSFLDKIWRSASGAVLGEES
jgi:hypothetical protein